MKAPVLNLSSAATVEINEIVAVITVRTGTADHDAVERIYTEFGWCEISHNGDFITVKFVDAKSKRDKTVYLGVARDHSP